MFYLLSQIIKNAKKNLLQKVLYNIWIQISKNNNIYHLNLGFIKKDMFLDNVKVYSIMVI